MTIVKHKGGAYLRPILIGLLAALFFSFTFILNRSMELAGGSWVWSASLRFFFMLPILWIFVGWRRNIKPVLLHIKTNPIRWIVWSTVGFGLFYAPLTYATIYAPGWLVAATFQLNIVAGSLLVPLINKANRKIPVQSIIISLIIIIGVILTQIEHAESVPFKGLVLTIIPLIISSISYPLGNRKMMQLVDGALNPVQRTLGMTIASLPFWLLLAIFGAFTYDAPSGDQVLQTLIVAITSGVIATILYFLATDMVRHDNHKLAGVEATTSAEIIFALVGELIFIGAIFPSLISWIGIVLVIAGIVLHSIIASLVDRRKLSERQIS